MIEEAPTTQVDQGGAHNESNEPDEELVEPHGERLEDLLEDGGCVQEWSAA